MNEALRQEIVHRQQAGTSARAIARELGLTRSVVRRVLAQLQAQRTQPATPFPAPRPRRGHLLDPYEPILKELLDKYPQLTTQRALQELQARGFRGGYTTVRLRVRQLRPRPAPVPVVRFETGPGFHYVKPSAMCSEAPNRGRRAHRR